MKPRKEYSCGIIPFYQGDKGIEVFLIHQISRWSDVIWTFPKGHIEKGETNLETAVRETYEETGLRPVVEDENMIYRSTYTILVAGEPVEKHVTYYIGFVSDKTFNTQPEEVDDAGWFAKEEALLKLTYQDAKDILIQIMKGLDNL